ncbi:Uncharacterised protein [Achromobacter xylosoxidans]|nr:Uncharacterised protein [Achromobacter xylosoxidans]CUI99019.1 Uncharacterised protein [Achromobacter xylosoxidans]CUJ31542.1 Uncharacterised protein [Achromobacter xylosoxidans]SQG76900.1 Uncharacterised protein [Achromobacter xylosoxidans]
MTPIQNATSDTADDSSSRNLVLVLAFTFLRVGPHPEGNLRHPVIELVDVVQQRYLVVEAKACHRLTIELIDSWLDSVPERPPRGQHHDFLGTPISWIHDARHMPFTLQALENSIKTLAAYDQIVRKVGERHSIFHLGSRQGSQRRPLDCGDAKLLDGLAIQSVASLEQPKKQSVVNGGNRLIVVFVIRHAQVTSRGASNSSESSLQVAEQLTGTMDGHRTATHEGASPLCAASIDNPLSILAALRKDVDINTRSIEGSAQIAGQVPVEAWGAARTGAAPTVRPTVSPTGASRESSSHLGVLPHQWRRPKGWMLDDRCPLVTPSEFAPIPNRFARSLSASLALLQPGFAEGGASFSTSSGLLIATPTKI